MKIVQANQKNGKVLRDIARPVEEKEFKTKELACMLADMEKVLLAEPDGVALAAPQVGISKRIFIVNPIAYKICEDQNFKIKRTIFINPEIIKRSSDKKTMEEGCLSVRPIYGKVKRASRVTIEAQDSDGKKFTMNGIGLIAQIFQHEIEHLDGILFIDKAKETFEFKPVQND